MRAQRLSGVVVCSEPYSTYTLKLQLQETKPQLLISASGFWVSWITPSSLGGKKEGEGKRRESS